MNAIRRPLKPKKCKHCRELFTPYVTLQIVCGYQCRQAYDRAQEFKRIKREQREGRERLKTRRDHEREAQRAFNAWIRWRDRDLPCICCGGEPSVRSRGRNHVWDAGHYRTTAAAPQLRFNEDNVHKQAVGCNRSKSGNAVEFRRRLVEKIGVARVEALENDHSEARYRAEDLIAIRKKYQERLRDDKRVRP